MIYQLKTEKAHKLADLFKTAKIPCRVYPLYNYGYSEVLTLGLDKEKERILFDQLTKENTHD